VDIRIFARSAEALSNNALHPTAARLPERGPRVSLPVDMAAWAKRVDNV